MSVQDEEKGLMTGEVKRAPVFVSPTAVVFAVVLVCGAFIAYTGGASTSMETPTVGSGVHHHGAAEVKTNDKVHPTAKNVRFAAATDTADAADAGAPGDGATELIANVMNEEERQSLDDLTIAVEMQLKLFLAPFKKFTTTELLVRVRDGIKAAIKGDSSYEDKLSVVVEEIDVNINSALAESVEKLEAMDDPEWMKDSGEAAKGAARRLLGSGEHDMNVMDYAGNFAAALNVSSDKMMELFLKMGAGVDGAVTAIVAEGDDASTQERLVLAALDLSAVSARAAPEPFGKGVSVVFDTAWSALLGVLPNIDVAAMSDLF